MTITNTWRLVRLVQVCGDVIAVAATYVLADYLRTRVWLAVPWPEHVEGFGTAVAVHYWTLPVLLVVWPILLARLGWYKPRTRRARSIRIAARALGAGLLAAMLLAGMALFFRRDIFPRMQIVLFAALLPATTLAARRITGWLGVWIAARQPRHVLIVGTGPDALRLRRLLRRASFGRSSVVGHLTLVEEEPARGTRDVEQRAPTSDGRLQRPPATGAVLGDLSHLGALLEREVIDEVFFAVRIEQLPTVLPAIRLCEEVGVAAHVLAESVVCHTIPEVEDVCGVPMLGYSPTRHAPELLLVKRMLDVVIAAVGIVLAGPIMLICAMLIRASGAGPVLFRQRRSGLNGRTFEMLKFRTMVIDAERRRDEIAHLNESQGPVFKVRDDPRVTRVGAAMRRWSLDELPQLFNVLRGEMSLVGPRPPLPEEVSQYDRWQRRRLSMRPGLTCLWQVNGRHRVPFDEWMKMDLYYIDHWSLAMDLRILARTVATVLSGSGA